MVFCYIDLNLCWRSDTISRWGWGSQGATQALAPVQRGLAGGSGAVARGAVAARQVLCPAPFSAAWLVILCYCGLSFTQELTSQFSGNSFVVVPGVLE